MTFHDRETQSRVAYDALSRIDQGVVYRDTSFFDQANRQILQMNQPQRDLIETEMVRSGLLPDATLQILGRETTFQAIDRDRNGRATRQEMDSYLADQSRNPGNRRNFAEEMVLGQIARRIGDTEVRQNDVRSFATERIARQTGFELAIREYDGLANIMRQRYPSQFSASHNRFEISSAETALRDDQSAQNRFLTDDQRKALEFMVSRRDDLYTTRLGMGTFFGLATQYFSQTELNRQATRNEVIPDHVRQADREHRQTLELFSSTYNIEHRVELGQTISDIAALNLRNRLGRAPNEQETNQLVETIARENSLNRPYRLNSGQVIRIPKETPAHESITTPPNTVTRPAGGPR